MKESFNPSMCAFHNKEYLLLKVALDFLYATHEGLPPYYTLFINFHHV